MGDHDVADGARVAHPLRQVGDAQVLHPLDCTRLPGIRGRTPAQVHAWLDHHGATPVPLDTTQPTVAFHTHFARPRTAVFFDYAPGDTAYVLVGAIEGTARVDALLGILEWVPAGAVTGYGLAYQKMPPPTLWAWITPTGAHKDAHFWLLEDAIAHVQRHGGVLLSNELPDRGDDGKREFHVVHPVRLLAWCETHRYADGTLPDYGPCKFYADLDAEYAFAPEMKDRAFAEAEVWRVVDAAVALLAEWGETATRDDFCFYETHRAKKFSMHVLSNAFYFETSWLARVFGRELESRLAADPATYRYAYIGAGGEVERRTVLDKSVYARRNNFRFLGKRTSDGDTPNYPVPWHHAGVHPNPAAERLRGIPALIPSRARRVGYDTFGVVGKTYLETFGLRYAHQPQFVPRAVRAGYDAGPLPAWYTTHAAPAIAAMGFEVRAQPMDDGGVHVRVLGTKRNCRDVVCPVHHRVHVKGSAFGAVYAYVHEGRIRWRCKKP